MAPRRLPIQIGMNARLFPNNWRPIREEISFAHAEGFEYLQVPGPEYGLDEEHLGAPLPAVAQALHEAELAVVMEIVFRATPEGATPAGQTPLEVLHANLPAITALECQRVHMHFVPAEIPAERLERESMLALERRLIPQVCEGAALAHSHGFRFGIEHNEPAVGLFSTPESCRAALDAAPGLGFVWDVNHTTREDLSGYLALTSSMTLLHISDTPLPQVNHHLPLGLGSIDFASYCEALLLGGFTGPAILEIGGLPLSGGYGRDTDAALRESREHLARAIAAAQANATR